MMGTLEQDAEDLRASLSESSRFTAIFERHVSEIHRYLSYRVGTDLADDLAAETFLRAFRGRGNFESGKGSVSAWLFGIASNLVRHHRRDEQRRLRLDQTAARSDSPSPEDDDFVDHLARRSELAKAIAELDAKSRERGPARRGAGFSYEETAAALAIPVGTVRSRLSRARDQVRSQLSPAPSPLSKGADPPW